MNSKCNRMNSCFIMVCTTPHQMPYIGQVSTVLIIIIISHYGYVFIEQSDCINRLATNRYTMITLVGKLTTVFSAIHFYAPSHMIQPPQLFLAPDKLRWSKSYPLGH